MVANASSSPARSRATSSSSSESTDELSRARVTRRCCLLRFVMATSFRPRASEPAATESAGSAHPGPATADREHDRSSWGPATRRRVTPAAVSKPGDVLPRSGPPLGKRPLQSGERHTYRWVRELSADDWVSTLATFSDHRRLGRDRLQELQDTLPEAINGSGGTVRSVCGTWDCPALTDRVDGSVRLPVR